jgi:hypothetical protein
MSIKKSCDVCKKEFTGRDECVDASLVIKNISGYDSGEKRYDLCEDCGWKLSRFIEKEVNKADMPRKCSPAPIYLKKVDTHKTDDAKKSSKKKPGKSQGDKIICRYSPNEDKGRCI